MEQYKTVDGLIAELQGSGNFFKDNPQLIDKASIYRWVHLALKNFGMNIMQKKSKVVEIENYKGILGNDFGKLSLAVFCECDKCVVPSNKKDKLLDTYFYTDRIKTKYIIESSVKDDSACATETCKESETRITEKFYLHEADCDVSLHYKNPSYVTLGRDVLYGGCTEDCVNRYVKDSPYSINIKNTTIYANFRSGMLYVEYYGLPQDENGIPIIPHTERSKLEQYLEVMIKRKILFDAQLSGDKLNIQFLYQDIYAEEKQLFREAQQDLSKLNLLSFWKLIDENRKRMNSFNVYLKQ